MAYALKRAGFGIGIALLLLIWVIPGAAAEPDEKAILKSMITELEGKIEDADKRMVAHPNFLEELRALVNKYRSQLREVYFIDTFEDGNFDQNPKWIVKSGEFSVRKKRLISFVQSPDKSETGTKTKAGKETSFEQEAVGILLDNLFGSPKKEEPESKETQIKTEPFEPAYIYTRKEFPPAFEISLDLKTSPGGSMDVVLLGTQDLIPRYRLKIHADHSKEDPIELVRESSSRSFIVGAGTKFPIINDGKFHTLTWNRMTDGAMKVLIDGQVILETYEVYYRDTFTGLGIQNNSGGYEWASFEIYKPQASL